MEQVLLTAGSLNGFHHFHNLWGAEDHAITHRVAWCAALQMANAYHLLLPRLDTATDKKLHKQPCREQTQHYCEISKNHQNHQPAIFQCAQMCKIKSNHQWLDIFHITHGFSEVLKRSRELTEWMVWGSRPSPSLWFCDSAISLDDLLLLMK